MERREGDWQNEFVYSVIFKDKYIVEEGNNFFRIYKHEQAMCGLLSRISFTFWSKNNSLLELKYSTNGSVHKHWQIESNIRN